MVGKNWPKVRNIVGECLKDAKEPEAEEGNKVKKLQELLEKCRLNMRENKEKIRQLMEENEKLKKSIESSNDEVKFFTLGWCMLEALQIRVICRQGNFFTFTVKS